MTTRVTAVGGAKKSLFTSPAASERLSRARDFIASQGSTAEVLVVGHTLAAAARLVREATSIGPSGIPNAWARASFGWRATTLTLLASQWAGPRLAERGVVPVGALALEAICARIIGEQVVAGALGRFVAIAERPGLVTALRRTLEELRLARAAPEIVVDQTIANLLLAYEAVLRDDKLADKRAILDAAVARARQEQLVLPAVVLLDVSIAHDAERELVRALVDGAERALVTMCQGDERTATLLAGMLDEATVPSGRAAHAGDGTAVTPRSASSGALRRLQDGLFAKASEVSEELARADGAALTLFSAPGESRECIEIARFVQREAERGVPFDRMAVLLRSLPPYRAHLEAALRRAGVPAYFTRGARRSHPAGRALLALLDCAAEGLSAIRFAEYLSLGQVPPAGLSPVNGSEAWAPPDVTLVPESGLRAPEEDDFGLDATERDATERAATEAAATERTATAGGAADATTADDGLPTPRLWERLIAEAGVIGGLERWQRRLAGRAHELDLAHARLLADDDPAAERARRDRRALDGLLAFALPLVELLDALPLRASWGQWLDALRTLAARSLRHADDVLAALTELEPMRASGPVDLREVRYTLEPRLLDLSGAVRERPYGRVFVGAIDEARGLAFDVVFVPGMAERMFPQRIAEDPLFSDEDRQKVAASLLDNASRSVAERLALRIAVGAASQRVYVSYPRLDVDQSRPRTPSFYALEVLRAAEGKLPGFDELGRRAAGSADARLGWPAPAEAADAVDDAEHDLALLASILHQPASETTGAARYLLSANPHLARALRFRARRWTKTFNYADGLVDPGAEARQALNASAFSQRAYSPTALQQYAACPYRFLLQAVHRLSPREEPVPLEEIDPLTRGAVLHAMQYEVHLGLRERGLLPITVDKLAAAFDEVETGCARVELRAREDLAPSIDRVWEDAMASLKADVREAVRREAEDTRFRPLHFELSFGLAGWHKTGRHDLAARDPASIPNAVELACGIELRGSIDLVEQGPDGILRVTDYKSGKTRVDEGTVIGGGEVLQPVLYSLALEKMTGTVVEGARLYYATAQGEYAETLVALDEPARQAAVDVKETIDEAMRQAFFPAAPRKGACENCDYHAVCGPYEEMRSGRKRRDRLVSLDRLRGLP